MARPARTLVWPAAIAAGAFVALELGVAHGQGAAIATHLVLSEATTPGLVRAEPPAVRDARALRGVPDLMQTDPELELPGGGDSHCGPVAASNALMWLADHGLPRLVTEAPTPGERQIALVRELASNRYMATSSYSGTGASGVMKGIDLYLRARGYRGHELRYQGWRAHQLRYSTGVRVPEIRFISDGLRAGGVALLNVGWYRPGKLEGAYRRKGGHWLTIVSAGLDEHGRDDPDALVVNDPAPWSGSEPRSHRVRAEALGQGWLIGEDGPFPSKGYRRLVGDLAVKRPGESAIIDGAVVLVPPRTLR